MTQSMKGSETAKRGVDDLKSSDKNSEDFSFHHKEMNRRAASSAQHRKENKKGKRHESKDDSHKGSKGGSK